MKKVQTTQQPNNPTPQPKKQWVKPAMEVMEVDNTAGAGSDGGLYS